MRSKAPFYDARSKCQIFFRCNNYLDRLVVRIWQIFVKEIGIHLALLMGTLFIQFWRKYMISDSKSPRPSFCCKQKKTFFAKFGINFVDFSSFFQLFCIKNEKNVILTSFWLCLAPEARRNIQKLLIRGFDCSWISPLFCRTNWLGNCGGCTWTVLVVLLNLTNDFWTCWDALRTSFK